MALTILTRSALRPDALVEPLRRTALTIEGALAGAASTSRKAGSRRVCPAAHARVRRGAAPAD